MALSAYVGNFSAPTSTGSYEVTGVGFQPKVVIFHVVHPTSAGTSTDFYTSLGFSDGTNHRTIGMTGYDNKTSSPYSVGAVGTSSCIAIRSTTVAYKLIASFTSLDADGFTLNFTTVDASVARVVNYLALGGATLTDTAIGTYTYGATAGDYSVTGLSFQPTSLILIGATGTGGTSWPISFINSSDSYTNDFACSYVSSLGAVRTSQLNYAYSHTLQTSTSVIDKQTFVSFNADGFTLNLADSASFTVRDAYYLALKGPSVDIGTITQPASTGNQSITTSGVVPKAVLLVSNNQETSTSVINDGSRSIGFASGASNRSCGWVGYTNGVSPTEADSALSLSKIIQLRSSSTTTINAEADLSSLDSGGFTLNWSTADATARELIYFAIGEELTTVPLDEEVADSLTLSDASSTNNISLETSSVADSANEATDAVSTDLSIALSISDTLDLSDAINLFAAYQTKPTDSIANWLDAVSKLSVQTRRFSDMLAMNDRLQVLFPVGKLVGDTLATSDSLSLRQSYLQLLADTITLNEATGVSNPVWDSSPFTDALSMSDGIGIYLSTREDDYFRRYLDDRNLRIGERKTFYCDTLAMRDEVEVS